MNPTGKAGGRVSESNGDGYVYEIYARLHIVDQSQK